MNMRPEAAWSLIDEELGCDGNSNAITKACSTNNVYSYRRTMDIIRDLKLRAEVDSSSKTHQDGSGMNEYGELLPSSIRNRIMMAVRDLLTHRCTHFNSAELSILARLFYVLAVNPPPAISRRSVTSKSAAARSKNKTDVVPRLLYDEPMQQFLHVTLGITDSIALSGLCRSAKTNANQSGITITEFICLLNKLLRGNLEERAVLAFSVLDYDNDGALRKNMELINLTRGLHDNAIAAANPDLDPEEPDRDTFDYVWHKLGSGNPLFADRACFVATVKKNPLLLESLAKFLPHERRIRALEVLLFGKS